MYQINSNNPLFVEEGGGECMNLLGMQGARCVTFTCPGQCIEGVARGTVQLAFERFR